MDETHTWYKRKPYIHFDLPLPKQKVIDYVTDPHKVAHHPFYPLLGYTLTKTKRKRLPRGSPTKFTKECKERPIRYPAHMDGNIFSYYKSLLEKFYEDWLLANDLSDAVTAFRPSTHENNLTLSKKAFDFIAKHPECQIVVTDVEAFYETLDHKILKRTWAHFIGMPTLPDDHYAVFGAITNYSVVQLHKAYNLFKIRISGRTSDPNAPQRICTPQEFREKVVPRGLITPNQHAGTGIPQGTSLSPLLSNMYMSSLDLAMSNWIKSLGGKYWRYCDDILIVVPGDQKAPLLSMLDQELKRLKLTRNRDKTDKQKGTSLSPSNQLQYLGLTFDGKNTRVRPPSIQRTHRKLKKAIMATRIRQQREAEASGARVPFRRRALYNMYSDLSVRGKRISQRQRSKKYKGNFTHYMGRASNATGSPNISFQKSKLLRHVYSRIKRERS